MAVVVAEGALGQDHLHHIRDSSRTVQRKCNPVHQGCYQATGDTGTGPVGQSTDRTVSGSGSWGGAGTP